MPGKPNRREFLHATSGAAAAAAATTSCGGAGMEERVAANFPTYESLGVRSVINAMGTVTTLGGSIMPPEVVAAMAEASKHFVSLPELQERAGRRLAELIGVPAAAVTCGAAAAITVGTAACVTLGDQEKLAQLPDTSGMKNEIIQQKAHNTGYQAQMLLVGTKIVWVETRQDFEKAINERTAMAFFLNKADPDGRIQRAEWIEVAKAHGIPTMNDAAADVPPPERLASYVDEGFDLVIFSGGKGLLGPQCTGLLLGREDLIQAGQKAANPNGGIGRGMKVGKEEIMGLVAAVERYLKADHEAERRVLNERATQIMDVLAGLEGVGAAVDVPDIANHVPHVLVRWDEEAKNLPAENALARLIAGDPPIHAIREGPGVLRLSTWTLRDGEAEILAGRVKALFV